MTVSTKCASCGTTLSPELLARFPWATRCASCFSIGAPIATPDFSLGDETRPICEACGHDVQRWNNLIQDDDGAWRCTSCRLRAMRDNSGWMEQRCNVGTCTKTAREHIEEFRVIVTTAAWEEKFATRRHAPDPPEAAVRG
jgi:hypothetical protein